MELVSGSLAVDLRLHAQVPAAAQRHAAATCTGRACWRSLAGRFWRLHLGHALSPPPIPCLGPALQAVTDVLCPLLQRRYGAWGASVVAALRQQLQAIERDVLEV